MKRRLCFKKLIVGSLLFGASVMSMAQIVHVDLNITGSASESIDLDIDGDGTVDFVIASGDFGLGDSFGIGTFNGNAVVSDTDSFPLVLDENENLDGTRTDWDAAEAQAFYLDFLNLGDFIPGFILGNWPGINNRFVGLQFDISGNTHYAWLQISVTDNATWTLTDYAYNTVADTPILAGQTMVLSNNEFESEIKSVFAYKKQLYVKGLESNFDIALYNSVGQSILKKKNINSNQFDLSAMDNGIYIVQLQEKKTGENLSKRLILSD